MSLWAPLAADFRIFHGTFIYSLYRGCMEDILEYRDLFMVNDVPWQRKRLVSQIASTWKLFLR